MRHLHARFVDWLIMIALILLARDASAQQVDVEDAPENPARSAPAIEWAFGLRAVTSLGAATTEDRITRTSFDFSDSLVYFRPRVPLNVFSQLRAGALFALTFPDTYNQPGTLFVGDANVFLENRWASLRLGRGRLTSHVIASPSLRDDDLIRFAELQNPFSNGESTADHQFGNVATLTLWPTPRLYADVHAENLSNSVLAPKSLAAFELNSVGLTLGYKATPSETTLAVIRQLGVGANAYHLAGRDWIFDAVAGSWLNLIVDPVHTVDWRAQAAFAGGQPGADPTTPTGSFRAQSVSAFTSVGYTYRRLLLPTFRCNIAGGYRRYLAQSLQQGSVLANAFWAIGQVVELGLQYQYRYADPGLPRIYGEDQAHSLKLVIVATFETVLNPLFDERTSILNTESGYLP